MAKTSSKVSTTFLKFALILSLFLVLAVAERRSVSAVAGSSTLTCKTVVGVESGDTCTGIANAHKLTLQAFLAINPNVNCDKIFIGQWICINGSEN